jgi:hypothetical protein
MDLSEIVNSIFIDRNLYKKVSNKEKESNFFIINRYLLKKYPNFSIKFNYKNIDKSLALDLLFLKIPKDTWYKSWFWYKKEKKYKTNLSIQDIKLLIEHLDLKDSSDVDRLYKINSKELLKELKIIKEEYGK